MGRRKRPNPDDSLSPESRLPGRPGRFQRPNQVPPRNYGIVRGHSVGTHGTSPIKLVGPSGRTFEDVPFAESIYAKRVNTLVHWWSIITPTCTNIDPAVSNSYAIQRMYSDIQAWWYDIIQHVQTTRFLTNYTLGAITDWVTYQNEACLAYCGTKALLSLLEMPQHNANTANIQRAANEFRTAIEGLANFAARIHLPPGLIKMCDRITGVFSVNNHNTVQIALPYMPGQVTNDLTDMTTTATSFYPFYIKALNGLWAGLLAGGTANGFQIITDTMRLAYPSGCLNFNGAIHTEDNLWNNLRTRASLIITAFPQIYGSPESSYDQDGFARLVDPDAKYDSWDATLLGGPAIAVNSPGGTAPSGEMFGFCSGAFIATNVGEMISVYQEDNTYTPLSTSAVLGTWNVGDLIDPFMPWHMVAASEAVAYSGLTYENLEHAAASILTEWGLVHVNLDNIVAETMIGITKMYQDGLL